MEIIPDYQARPAGPNFQTVHALLKNQKGSIPSVSFLNTFKQHVYYNSKN